MVKTTTADALNWLQDALATLPSEQDARSHVFLQWRGNTIQALELAFPQDHEPVRQFKEIEFSPRRLSRDEARDAQLKLDAYLAGCAAARGLLEAVIRRLGTSLEESPEASEPATELQSAEPRLQAQIEINHEPSEAAPPQPEIQRSANVETAPVEPTPAQSAPPRTAPKTETQIPEPLLEVLSVATPASEPAPAAPAPLAAPAPPRPPEKKRRPRSRHPLDQESGSRPTATQTRPQPIAARVPLEGSFSTTPIIAGAAMDTRELCLPVRNSLARVLGAWERGERDMVLVLSAQLLADLTVLSRNETFRSAFERVVSKAVDGAAADALKSAGPLCVWSVVAAMNEVMKN